MRIVVNFAGEGRRRGERGESYTLRGKRPLKLRHISALELTARHVVVS